MSPAHFAVNFFVALFALIDPVGSAPLFAAATADATAAGRRLTAVYIAIFSFVFMVFFFVTGVSLLRFFGISLAAFRIAGGLLLFAIAFEMVFQRRTERKADQTGQPGAALATFPLAIPLMAGPGAITAMMLLASQLDTPMGLAALIAIMGATLLAAYIVFRFAGPLERLLGRQGEAVLGRLLGVLLAALAVQYVADGVRALAP